LHIAYNYFKFCNNKVSGEPICFKSLRIILKSIEI